MSKMKGKKQGVLNAIHASASAFARHWAVAPPPPPVAPPPLVPLPPAAPASPTTLECISCRCEALVGVACVACGEINVLFLSFSWRLWVWREHEITSHVQKSTLCTPHRCTQRAPPEDAQDQGPARHELDGLHNSGRFLIRLSDSLFLAPQSDLEKKSKRHSKGLGEKRPNPGCFWFTAVGGRCFWRRKNYRVASLGSEWQKTAHTKHDTLCLQ
jgi:hypothetical protein